MTGWNKEALRRLNGENLDAMTLAARLLQAKGPLFTPEEVNAFAADCGLDPKAAFRLLLSAACGLDGEAHPAHRLLEQEYLFPALGWPDPLVYEQNPYHRLLRSAEGRHGRWVLTHRQYAPYQVFACGSTRLTEAGRIIPRLGCFTVPFSYPIVLENGREWMTVTPNEVETMAMDIAAARGRALVLGLGLGYFAFMLTEKPEISAVAVVEREADAIALFREKLLPLFPKGEKITLVQADAFSYLEKASDRFDFVYADLWHDVSDGLPLYLRLRQLEGRLHATDWRYWIEQDMLLFLRGLVMDDAANGAGRLERLIPPELTGPEEAFSLPALKALAADSRTAGML